MQVHSSNVHAKKSLVFGTCFSSLRNCVLVEPEKKHSGGLLVSLSLVNQADIHLVAIPPQSDTHKPLSEDLKKDLTAGPVLSAQALPSL